MKYSKAGITSKTTVKSLERDRAVAVFLLILAIIIVLFS